MDVSQLGFKNTIHPMPQSSPLVVHLGGDRLELDDMHMVTHMLRLIASERARCSANVKSALIPRMALRETKVPIAGAANEAMIASSAIVTNNSMSVSPAKRFEHVFMVEDFVRRPDIAIHHTSPKKYRTSTSRYQDSRDTVTRSMPLANRQQT